MAKHALRERITPADLCSQVKNVEGVGSIMLAHGEKLVIDLGTTPALSPFVPSDVGVWQRLRAIIAYPDPNRPPYALVEVLDRKREQRLFLAAVSDGQEPARFVRTLDSGRATANAPTWQATTQASEGRRFVAIEHSGAGATEVIGATTQEFQGEEHLIPVESWAPPANEVLYKSFPPS